MMAARASVRVVLVTSCCAVSAQGAILYSDSFDVDPATDSATGRTGFTTGWTEAVANAATGTVVSNGTGAAVLDRTATSSPASAILIRRFFDASGFKNIQVVVNAFQSATTYESVDNLQIEYSVDGTTNVIDLLLDPSQWNGNSTSEGSAAGNTLSMSSGLLSLPATADNNTQVLISIRAIIDILDEDYFIDSFELHGTPIPEPTSLVLSAAAGLVLMVRQRN